MAMECGTPVPLWSNDLEPQFRQARAELGFRTPQD
jgi:hypothetical protein